LGCGELFKGALKAAALTLEQEKNFRLKQKSKLVGGKELSNGRIKTWGKKIASNAFYVFKFGRKEFLEMVNKEGDPQKRREITFRIKSKKRKGRPKTTRYIIGGGNTIAKKKRNET